MSIYSHVLVTQDKSSNTKDMGKPDFNLSGSKRKKAAASQTPILKDLNLLLLLLVS